MPLAEDCANGFSWYNKKEKRSTAGGVLLEFTATILVFCFGHLCEYTWLFWVYPDKHSWMQLLLIFTFQTYNLFVISVFLSLGFFKGSLTLIRDVLRSRLESSDVAHLELSQASLLRHRWAHDSPPDFVFCPIVALAAVSCDLDHRERLFSSHWKLLHHLVAVITAVVSVLCAVAIWRLFSSSVCKLCRRLNALTFGVIW